MTREHAQIVLLQAFIATGELPEDITRVLTLLINATAHENTSG